MLKTWNPTPPFCIVTWNPLGLCSLPGLSETAHPDVLLFLILSVFFLPVKLFLLAGPFEPLAPKSLRLRAPSPAMLSHDAQYQSLFFWVLEVLYFLYWFYLSFFFFFSFVCLRLTLISTHASQQQQRLQLVCD